MPAFVVGGLVVDVSSFVANVPQEHKFAPLWVVAGADLLVG